MDIYETAEYEIAEDYGQNANHYFGSLAETASFLYGLGFSLEHIKRASEIGAP